MKDIFERIPFCPHGSKASIDAFLVAGLIRIEHDLGVEFTYNSGYRCYDCNVKAGGAVHSAHLRGKAVDIKCTGSRDRLLILRSAFKMGFRRCGIGHNIVHLDVDTSLDQDVAWVY